MNIGDCGNLSVQLCDGPTATSSPRRNSRKLPGRWLVEWQDSVPKHNPEQPFSAAQQTDLAFSIGKNFNPVKNFRYHNCIAMEFVGRIPGQPSHDRGTGNWPHQFRHNVGVEKDHWLCMKGSCRQPFIGCLDRELVHEEEFQDPPRRAVQKSPESP